MHNPAIRQSLREMMLLAWEVEARDPYTSGHLWRVSKFAHLTATALNWSTLEIAKATLGAFLHDIGKLHTPLEILNKPGPLTDSEYQVIQHHPVQGYELIKENPFSHFVADAILYHHERADGQGYPKGLDSNAVSKHVKLISLCDAFDAMTSQRPYRAPMIKERALDILQAHLGTQFDIEVGSAFIDLGRNGKFDHIILHSDEGIPLQHCPMCGPTIEVTRHQNKGDLTRCRVCGTQYTVSDAAVSLDSKEKNKHMVDHFIDVTIDHLP